MANRSLFSLGITLIELHYGVHFDALKNDYERQLDRNGLIHGIGTFQSATRLATMLYDDAGAYYGNAVSRCIKGLESRYTSLEK